MGLFKGVAAVRSRIKLAKQHMREWDEITDQLVQAVFEPYYLERRLLHPSDSVREYGWEDSGNPAPAMDFVNELGLLQEFYWVWNPVLASSLTGIWDSILVLHNEVWLTTNPVKGRKQLKVYKSLVASAVRRFADGKAGWADSPSYLENMDALKAERDSAIALLQELQPKIRAEYGT